MDKLAYVHSLTYVYWMAIKNNIEGTTVLDKKVLGKYKCICISSNNITFTFLFSSFWVFHLMKFHLRVRKYFTRKFSITSAFCTFYLLEFSSWIKCFASAQLSKYIVLSVWFDLSASPLLPLCNFAEATIPLYSGHTVSVQSKKSNLLGAKYVHLAWPQLTAHICPTIWWLVT